MFSPESEHVTDQVRITLSLDSYDVNRLAIGLTSDRLPAEVAGNELTFTDTELGFSVEVWYERLMRLNRSIHAQARRSGREIQPYKTLDRVNLLLAIITAANEGSLARMAHEVVWRQPFPNANHRTVVAALAENLNLELPTRALPELIDSHFARSKELLDGSDRSLTDEEARLKHQTVMAEMVAALQSLK